MKFKVRNYSVPLKIWKARRLMKKAPAWSREQLEEWSRDRRKALAIHAYNNVPYYRRLFDEHGIRPEKIDDAEVWGRMPTLDKVKLRDNGDKMISGGKPPRGSFWASTSGSTGLMLNILLDNNVNAAAFAMLWRTWESGGYWRFGQIQAAMKGQYYTEGWKYVPIIRTLHISPTQMRPDTIHFYRDLIERYKPRFLRSYPSAVYLLCRLLREQNLSLHIPMVVSGAEVLYDFQRAEIERTLGARVYNHYTHWERAASILECDCGNLHCQEDYGHVELLDPEGNPVPAGVIGEITATGLHNLAMPLIRYRTGDMGVWSTKSCSCGQSFPLMERIEGRTTDYLVRFDGSLISGTVAMQSCREPSPGAVLYIQVIQSELGRVEMRVVKGKSFKDPEHTDYLINELRQKLGDGMKVDVRFCTVDELERNPIGKVRYCYNKLKMNPAKESEGFKESQLDSSK